VKVAPRALLISLSRWETTAWMQEVAQRIEQLPRVGVRETIMVPTTYIFRGGVGAMIVSEPSLSRPQTRE